MHISTKIVSMVSIMIHEVKHRCKSYSDASMSFKGSPNLTLKRDRLSSLNLPNLRAGHYDTVLKGMFE